MLHSGESGVWADQTSQQRSCLFQNTELLGTNVGFLQAISYYEEPMVLAPLSPIRRCASEKGHVKVRILVPLIVIITLKLAFAIPMPPQISLLPRGSRAVGLQSIAIASFLLPFLHSHQQHRKASILSSLSNIRSSYGHRKRVGRGPSSGKGKTAGKGMSGQKKRGTVPFIQSLGRHFNGGQTPNEVVHGKHGGHNPFSVTLQTVNLSKLTSWIAQDRIDPTRPITVRELHQSRCIASTKDGVKLLATGKESLPPNTPLHIITSRASAAAIAAVEAGGGKVSTRYYTPFALRQIVRGRMDPVHSMQSDFDEAEWGEKRPGGYRLPDPTSRKDIEYYRDVAKRGYLSRFVPEGEGPSLFFKTPRVKRGRAFSKRKGTTKGMEANKIW